MDNQINYKEILATADGDILYILAKEIAESDSIGEGWGGYCDEYDHRLYDLESKEITEDKYPDEDNYLKCALRIYDKLGIYEEE